MIEVEMKTAKAHDSRQRITNAFRARVARLPGIGMHPALKIDPWVEGYKNFTFGGSAAGHPHISNVFHELAHAAEFGARRFQHRATSVGFHFKTPQKFIFNTLLCEPRTMQMTMREIRTFAYQIHLMQAAGLHINVEAQFTDMAVLCDWLPDHWNIPGHTYSEKRAWCRNEIISHYQSVTQQDVLDKLKGWLDAHHRANQRMLNDLRVAIHN